MFRDPFASLRMTTSSRRPQGDGSKKTRTSQGAAGKLACAMYFSLRLRTAVAASSLFIVCGLVGAPSAVQERADRFLALANAGFQGLYRVNSEAQWLAVTDVTSEH